MANIKLTKAWTALSVTTGTIQNMSVVYNLEVSEDNTVGSGQILFPRNGFSFDGVQLYARVVAEDDTEVEARVSPFVESAGSGSGSGSGGGTVIPYVLPTATSSVKGGVMVGDGLKINNASLAVDTGSTAGKIVKIEADGKIDSSILPAIAIGNTFVETSEANMLALTATVGDVCVRNDEHQSYILQTAPASVKANWIKLETPASDVTSVNGKTGAVTITLPTKVSELTNDANYLTSVPKATKTSAGTVIIGDGIDVDSTGKISVTASGGSYTLPAATTTDLGGVKVGQNLEIDTNGILKSKHPTVTMGTNTTSTETVASGGSFTAIDSVTKDINGHVTKVNTKTVTIPTLPVQATDTAAGIAKLYTVAGTNTDGAITQKAVGDNYYPLTGGTLKGNTINRDVSDNHLVVCGGKNNNDGGAVLLFGKDSTDTRKGSFIIRAHSDTTEWNLSGDTAGNLTWGNKKVAVGDFLPLAGGTMTGAIESKNTALQNTTSNYMRIQQSATLQNGAVLDFYGRDDTNGGRVVIACGTPDGSSYKSLVVSGNGSLTFNNHNILVDNVVDGAINNVSGTIQNNCYAKKCGNLVTFYIYTSDSTSLVFAKLPWKPVSPQVFCGLMGNSTSTLQTKLIGVDADGSVRNFHDTTAWKTNIVSGCYFTTD